MRIGSKKNHPDWPRRLLDWRLRSGFSQAGLGEKLGVSPMAISRWERGLFEPSAEVYIALGKIAGPPECWWFWARAGLSRTYLQTLLPGRDGHH